MLSFDRVAGTRELASRFVEPLAGLEPGLIDLQLFSGETDEHTVGDAFFSRLVDVVDSLRETVFVIDCFDGLEPPSLREDMLAFIAQTAPHIHFVVAVRSERLVPQVAHDVRLQDDVAFLREPDLLFDRDEARDLLGRESRRLLDDADISNLVARTEGWPTGLHLAALSLRAADRVAGWVDRFDGADEYVASYFTDVVMPQYSPEQQRFLLTTSLLDRLTGSLCDTVTGTNDGTTMLHLLEERSAFRRRPMDGEDIFVFDRLFGEYLRSRFRVVDPAGERHVLGRAADWYLAHDDIEEAVPYLLRAQDWERVLEAVSAAGRGMHEQARPTVALAWLEAVPHAVREGRNDVALMHAVLRHFVGDTLGAEEILRRMGAPRSLPPGVRAVADVLRSTWVEVHLAPGAVLEAADNALGILDTLRFDELPDVLGITSHRDLQVIALTSRARALWFAGDVASARAGLEQLLEDGDLYPTWHINILGTLALLEAWCGQLRRAQQHATYAFRIAAETRRSRPSSLARQRVSCDGTRHARP